VTKYPEPDKVRENALRAAVDDLAAAVHRGDGTEEELAAAIEAVRQIPIDFERMVNALHVPEDAGEHEPALRALLERIPDGWGRWIQCGAGWYPILVRLGERRRNIDPGFEVHQIKEKFGTLWFYWAGRNCDAGEAAVAVAEAESARTCERCGGPGRLRTRNGWLRTLCDSCGRSDGYVDVPDDEEN